MSVTNRYLGQVSMIFAAAILAAALANLLVDPWSLFPKAQMKNLKRPQVEPHARLYKDIQALYGVFDTVHVGSSRVDVGLPVEDLGFNFAYPGGGLEESLLRSRLREQRRKAWLIANGR